MQIQRKQPVKREKKNLQGWPGLAGLDNLFRLSKTLKQIHLCSQT